MIDSQLEASVPAANKHYVLGWKSNKLRKRFEPGAQIFMAF